MKKILNTNPMYVIYQYINNILLIMFEGIMEVNIKINLAVQNNQIHHMATLIHNVAFINNNFVRKLIQKFI